MRLYQKRAGVIPALRMKLWNYLNSRGAVITAAHVLGVAAAIHTAPFSGFGFTRCAALAIVFITVSHINLLIYSILILEDYR